MNQFAWSSDVSNSSSCRKWYLEEIEDIMSNIHEEDKKFYFNQGLLVAFNLFKSFCEKDG